jgi:uncharacterized protein
MRLVLDNDPGLLTVRRYEPGEIAVGEQLLRAPCLLSAQRIVADWSARSVAGLVEADLAAVLALEPQVLLLGTDAAGERPALALRRQLEARGIAVETMGLGAACRTYSVLVQEFRPVVAGLFP